MTTGVALVLALLSTILTNVAYLREHDAAAELPVLCMRRPLQSARVLLGDRTWLSGFALETLGFLLYAVALALASLALVQSIAAGGIGVLAYASARFSRRRLSRRELAGVIVSMLGLVALAVSLAGGSGEGDDGSLRAIVLWLLISAAVAVAVIGAGRRFHVIAAAFGIAGGIFFSIGDIATKVTTQGGTRLLFVVPLVIGYTVGTALLQVGYQAGGALTVAGLATLLTNALPIVAGTVLLDEPIPSGAFGALRVIAFVAVVVGAFLLARPEKPAAAATRVEPQPTAA
jgi:hypothetical protein